jgi:septal ring factor EnvC (AmiA/AmiB activator)
MRRSVLLILAGVGLGGCPGCVFRDINRGIAQSNDNLTGITASFEKVERSNELLDSINRHLESVDTRMASLEGRLTSVDTELARLGKTLDAVEAHLRSLQGTIEKIDGLLPFVDISVPDRPGAGPAGDRQDDDKGGN